MDQLAPQPPGIREITVRVPLGARPGGRGTRYPAALLVAVLLHAGVAIGLQQWQRRLPVVEEPIVITLEPIIAPETVPERAIESEAPVQAAAVAQVPEPVTTAPV